MPARGRRSRRRSAVILAVIAAMLVLGLESFRFLQLNSDFQAARSALGQALSVAELAGPSMTVADVAAIGDEMARADAGLVRARGMLDSDPLLGILRVIPPIATQINAATRMASAAQRLTSEHPAMTRLLQRFIQVRDSTSGAERLAGFVRFTADQQDSISAVLKAFEDASSEMSGVSDADLVEPLAAARGEVRQYLDRFTPLAEGARPLLRATPSLFGVGTSKRYLVLALDNAELRPIGGLIAAFATLTVSDGRLGDLEFRDIALVDRPDQNMYVSPPVPLQDHLLGDFTWQVADAGWWPDFARSAEEARRLYAIESGDVDFDGVIAFTPDLVDALIGVLGPVEVPGTGITVRPGETYVRSLEEVEIKNTGATRKRFLADLASAVFARLEQLPPGKYPAMLAALADAVDRRQIQVLPNDAASRGAMIELGAYTPFTFEDGADRLAIMGANVAPVSKLHALLDIHHELVVVLHADGSADQRLTTTYINRFGPDLPSDLAGVAPSFFSGNLGTYERRYLPPEAEVLSVRSVGSGSVLTDPESLELESGCLAVGNYLFVQPGTVQLETTYHTLEIVQPPAEPGGTSLYRLQFHKQPGRDHDGLIVRVEIPDGASLSDWTDGGRASGSVVTFSGTTVTDRVFDVRFTLP